MVIIEWRLNCATKSPCHTSAIPVPHLRGMANPQVEMAHDKKLTYDRIMSRNHSIGQKNRWKKVSQEERHSIMKHLAKKKQVNLTPEERHRNAVRMVKAREKKRRLILNSK